METVCYCQSRPGKSLARSTFLAMRLFGKMPDDMCHKHQRHREVKCSIMSKQQSPLSKIRLSLYNIEHHFVKTRVCIHKMAKCGAILG